MDSRFRGDFDECTRGGIAEQVFEGDVKENPALVPGAVPSRLGHLENLYPIIPWTSNKTIHLAHGCGSSEGQAAGDIMMSAKFEFIMRTPVDETPESYNEHYILVYSATYLFIPKEQYTYLNILVCQFYKVV